MSDSSEIDSPKVVWSNDTVKANTNAYRDVRSLTLIVYNPNPKSARTCTTTYASIEWNSRT